MSLEAIREMVTLAGSHESLVGLTYEEAEFLLGLLDEAAGVITQILYTANGTHDRFKAVAAARAFLLRLGRDQ